MSFVHTRFVLIETSHAGNVGAVARAIKVMGFEDLVLVQPRWPDVLHCPEAVERASGAQDILDRARVVSDLPEALDGITQVCATVMTARDFGPPTYTPRDYFDQLLNRFHACGPCGNTVNDERRDETPRAMAFIFGSERYGMKNEDVYRCHAALSIPTNPAYGSLNLAAAVQLIAYDWRLALARFQATESGEMGPSSMSKRPRLADAQQLSGMLAHWQQALEAVGYLDPCAPKKLMPRLTQLFNRAHLTTEEIHVLRGIAKAMIGTAAEKR